jgi:molecular chaperone GrpE
VQSETEEQLVADALQNQKQQADLFESLDKQMTEADEKIAYLNDQLVRSLAEKQRLHSRAENDIEDAQNYAIGGFVKDLLAVADNFDRALGLVDGDLEDDNKLKPFVDGIELTQKELQRVFEAHHVERHMPLDEPFDHNLHQALFDVPASDKPPGTVVQVVQPGYSLNGRLLRPAMVGVAAEE